MQKNWHALKKEDVTKALEVKESVLDKGLTENEAKNRLKIYGKNKISKGKKTPEILIFLKQFNSPLIYILIIAMIISFIFDHKVDAYVILGVLIFNATIGYFQERKAEKAIQALKKMVVSHVKVYREGKLVSIPSSEIVPGDLISLEKGDKVPADARLLEIKNFRTQEASLTGESLPTEKSLKLLSPKTSLADRKNMAFMGTLVVSGQAKAVVVSTSNKTEIGKVAKSIGDISPPKLHFDDKVRQLTIQMASFALIGSLAIFLVGFFVKGLEFFDIFLFTLASLVSAIPEGLPAVLIVVLAIGARKMANRNAVIRHLPAVESMGVVTVIATDKTGTLTKNTLTVDEIYCSNKNLEVTGRGWESEGEFVSENKEINPLKIPELSKLLHISTLSNKSNVTKKGSDYEIVGDPTEASLLVLSRKASSEKENLKDYKVIDDLAFSSEFKFRATLVQKERSKELFSIGAFEEMLKLSEYYLDKNKKVKLTEKKRKELMDKAIEMTHRGKRVLGISYKDLPYHTKSISPELVSKMVFVGLVGMRDTPRKGVKKSISQAKKAGIRVIMQTGDHKETAFAIAKEIGLAEENENVLTQADLEKLSDREFSEVVKNTNIFARVAPNMKLKIVKTLQDSGETVAMTGDGVNDAPALKKSDIGISMGVIGTDVARESSEIVLADDNFSSIVNSVEEGRIVFRNVRQVSTYLVTTSVAEQLTILSAISTSLPLPLLPIHILWMNLVTDGFVGVSLAAEKSHGTALDIPPKKKKEKILNKEALPFLLIMASIMVIGTISIFIYLNNNFEIERAMTGAFLTMTFCQLFNVLNMRSMHKSIFRIGFLTNKWILISLAGSLVVTFSIIYLPFLQKIFSFSSLILTEVLAITAVSSLVLVAGEIYKFFRFRKSDKVFY